jgi:hypothetical protein
MFRQVLLTRVRIVVQSLFQSPPPPGAPGRDRPLEQAGQGDLERLSFLGGRLGLEIGSHCCISAIFHRVGKSLERGMMPYPEPMNTQQVVRRPTLGEGKGQMLHWKAKLASVAVVAALLASFLAEGDGWAW